MAFDFYIVDVFTDTQFCGNPLAVVVNANKLDKTTKQSIAAEMNFSETCFLNAIVDMKGRYELEIFTPSQEIAFAGHPILGAAKVLVDQYCSTHEESISIKLKNAEVKVSFEYNGNDLSEIWFSSPVVTIDSTASHDDVADIINVNKEIFHNDYPIQVISASTSILILPFSSSKHLKEFKVDKNMFTKLRANNYPNLLYCFSDETFDPQNDYQVRFFFESNGVREDPATGNGAAFFGNYLMEHKVVDSNQLIKIEQGHDMNHPSLIFIKFYFIDNHYMVKVGGNVVLNVKGEILV